MKLGFQVDGEGPPSLEGLGLFKKLTAARSIS